VDSNLATDLLAVSAHLQTAHHASADALRVLSRLLGVLDLDLVVGLVDQAAARLEAAQGRLARLVEEAIKALELDGPAPDRLARERALVGRCKNVVEIGLAGLEGQLRVRIAEE